MDGVFSNTFLLAQVIGVIGMIFAAISWQLADPKKILFVNNANYALWALHFYILSAPAGVMINIISLIKNNGVIYAPERYLKYVIISYVVFAIGWGVFTWGNIYNLFPIVGTSVFNLCLLYRDKRELIARGLLFAEACWIPYSLHTGSYIGVLFTIIVGSAVVIGMARHEKWEIGKCYRSFLPSVGRELFIKPQTYP